MAKTVFILGAGASKDAGVPLMADFLDVADVIWKSGSAGANAAQFETVFRAIGRLQEVHSKSQLDIQNVESVFAAFEMARTLGKFADYAPQDIDALAPSMKSLIVTTVQNTLRLPVQRRSAVAPIPYPEFANMIRKVLQSAQPKHTVAIITFNYDMAMDLALHYAGIPFFYGLATGERPEGIPLLKLHGSLNWTECSICGAISPVSLPTYFSKYSWHFMDEETKWVTMAIGDHVRDFPHDTHAVRNEPFIVPPTWNKAQYHSALSSVWGRAAKELSEAENVIVVGYSLPPTDFFFRYLYALGSVGPITLKRFWVFNPDTSGDVQDRFRRMLGPGAIQRFKYLDTRFADAVGAIAQALLPS